MSLTPAHQKQWKKQTPKGQKRPTTPTKEIKMDLSIYSARAAIKIIANAQPDDLAMVGLMPDDIELLTGEEAWRAPQRPKIVKALEAVGQGALILQNLPPMNLNAEYRAAVIFMVHPFNVLVACDWLQGGYTADALANPEGQTQNYQATRDQLLALVQKLYSVENQVEYAGVFRAKAALAVKAHKAKTGSGK